MSIFWRKSGVPPKQSLQSPDTPLEKRHFPAARNYQYLTHLLRDLHWNRPLKWSKTSDIRVRGNSGRVHPVVEGFGYDFNPHQLTCDSGCGRGSEGVLPDLFYFLADDCTYIPRYP